MVCPSRRDSDRHVIIPAPLWRKLKAYAKRRKQSASAALRELLAELFDVQEPETIRTYNPDGQHTPAAMEARKTARDVSEILKQLP